MCSYYVFTKVHLTSVTYEFMFCRVIFFTMMTGPGPLLEPGWHQKGTLWLHRQCPLTLGVKMVGILETGRKNYSPIKGPVGLYTWTLSLWERYKIRHFLSYQVVTSSRHLDPEWTREVKEWREPIHLCFMFVERPSDPDSVPTPTYNSKKCK